MQHLEDVDVMVRQIAREIVTGGRGRVRLVVTGDHTTPVGFQEHSCEPVACVVGPAYCVDSSLMGKAGDPTWRADRVSLFDEADIGMHGCMGRFKGLELIEIIKHHIASSQCDAPV